MVRAQGHGGAQGCHQGGKVVDQERSRTKVAKGARSEDNVYGHQQPCSSANGISTSNQIPNPIFYYEFW